MQRIDQKEEKLQEETNSPQEIRRGLKTIDSFFNLFKMIINKMK